jgi:hypothetical protein
MGENNKHHVQVMKAVDDKMADAQRLFGEGDILGGIKAWDAAAELESSVIED